MSINNTPSAAKKKTSTMMIVAIAATISVIGIVMIAWVSHNASVQDQQRSAVEQKVVHILDRIQQWLAKRNSLSGRLDLGGSMRTEAASIISEIREIRDQISGMRSVPGYTEEEADRLMTNFVQQAHDMGVIG